MTDEEHMRRSCLHKVRHPTAAEAFYVSLLTWKLKHGHAWPYECRYCFGWHTGRVPESVRLLISELVQSDQFSGANEFAVRRLRIYDPALIH
jgi:hypothetical protein